MPSSEQNVIYERKVYSRGNKSIMMLMPHVDPSVDLVTYAKPMFKGKSAKILKQTHNQQGVVIRQEPMPFDIDALTLHEAFEKYDDAELAAAQEMSRPKIAIGTDLPKLVG